MSAKQGDYSQSPWSAVSSASTIGSQMSFSITTDSQPSPPFSISIGSLTPETVITAANKANISVSTNAVSGVTIYILDSNQGLKSTTGNHTITAISANLASATEGYGVRGVSVNQISGGPMQILSPYNGASNNVGIVDSSKRQIFNSSSVPVTTGTGKFELQAKAGSITPAGSDYSDTLTIIAASNY